MHSAVALEGEGVVALPGGAARGAQLAGVALVVQAPVLAARAGQPPQLAVLVHRVDDPVDAWVLSDRGPHSNEPHLLLRCMARRVF